MTQVSRMPLSKNFEKHIHSLLLQALADSKTESEVELFLEDLLTPTERIMFGKRLAIAILLDKGYDQRTVHRILHVSVSTVNSVNYWLQNRGDGYRRVIGKLKTQKEWSELKNGVEDFLKTFFSAHRQLTKMRGI